MRSGKKYDIDASDGVDASVGEVAAPDMPTDDHSILNINGRSVKRERFPTRTIRGVSEL